MTAAIANTTTTVAAGEGGLGSYLAFCDGMAATCGKGAEITETTLADMRAAHNDWGPEKTQDIQNAMEQIKAAQNSFLQGKAALEKSLSTADVVRADTGVGSRESLTNI